MVRGLLSLSMCVAALLIVGCQGDERKQVAQKVIKEMTDTKNRLADIRGKVEEAVSKGKVTDDVFKLDSDSADAAKKLMKDLKDDKDGPVKRMLEYENEAKKGKPYTDDQKKEFADAIKGQLGRAIADVTEEYGQLMKAIGEATKKDKEGGQALNEELTNALGDLEKIAQRR